MGCASARPQEVQEEVVGEEGLALKQLNSWMKPHLVKKQGKAWKQKTLKELSELTELKLDEIGFSSLPPEIGHLRALEKLYLQDNGLQAIPPEVGQMEALKVCWLQENLLASLPPELGKLKALEEIWAGKNQLSALPTEIGQLTNLRVLDLKGNRLTTLPPELGQITQLKKLIADKNRLATIPAEFGSLVNLRTLSLEENRLTDVPSEIGQLTGLEILVLSRNRISVLPPEVGKLKGLKELMVDQNQLEAFPNELNGLKNLKVLKVAKNKVTGPFTLQPLWDALAKDAKATLQVSGNKFTLPDVTDEKWTEGKLHKAITTECEESSICIASFCGDEFLDWQLLLMRAAVRPEPPLCSQICIFLTDYSKIVKRAKAPSDQHVDGLGGTGCVALTKLFKVADEFTNGQASKAHEVFGCVWLKRWILNVEDALKKGHRRFIVFTKVDKSLGVCQTVEWLYLLKVKQRYGEGLEVECFSVSETMQVLEYAPLFKTDDFRKERISPFAKPHGPPGSLSTGLSEALNL